MSVHKAFSQLFQENDALARAASVEHLKDRKETAKIEQNEDRYGVDVLYSNSAKPDVVLGLECEVKHSWAGGEFPFGTIQIPHRKEKFFAQGASFLLLSKNGQDYLVLSPLAILESTLAEVPNKYVSEGEQFYQVDKRLASFYRFRFPVSPRSTFCCGEQSLERQGENGVWVCGACGEVSK